MITDRDICLAAATKHRPAAEISVSEVVSGPLHAVRADDDAKEALRVMRETQGAARAGRRLQGTLQGVVSINDFILRAEAKTGRDSLLGTEVMDPLKRICQHRALNVQGHASHPIGSARATRDERSRPGKRSSNRLFLDGHRPQLARARILKRP